MGCAARLIETIKLNDIDPLAWLADMLARLRDHPAKRIDELLPWNWKIAPSLREGDNGACGGWLYGPGFLNTRSASLAWRFRLFGQAQSVAKVAFAT